MTYDSLITLLTPEGPPTVNAYGDKEQTYIREDRLCAVQSVGMSEKYKALAVGLDPELVFILADRDEYDAQRYVEYAGDRYTVLRTYRKNWSVELVAAKIKKG